FFSSRRRHTRCLSDWSSDVCSSDLTLLTSVNHTVDVHYARVANSSLQVFQVAKGLARDLNAPHIATSVKILSEKLGRAGGHRTRSEERRVGKECRTRGAEERGKEKR